MSAGLQQIGIKMASKKNKAIVYNSQNKGRKGKDKPEKSKITREHLDFLRTAEMLNEVDVDADDFGGGLLAAGDSVQWQKAALRVRVAEIFI